MQSAHARELSGSTILSPHYITNGTIFGGWGVNTEHKIMCYDFLYKFYVKNLSFSK